MPAVPEVLTYLGPESEMDAAEAYSTLNVGCGFAVYCKAGSAERVVTLASELGLSALVAGQVESGPRRVILEPVRVTFESDRLDLSPRR
jgi:phosphoribosylformylglycinamidine cyclo-ligase